MPQDSLFICSHDVRIKYPESYDLSNVEAARRVASRVARVFIGIVLCWHELSPEQQNDLVVEIDDESGQTVLTVPFKEAKEPNFRSMPEHLVLRYKAAPPEENSSDGAS